MTLTKPRIFSLISLFLLLSLTKFVVAAPVVLPLFVSGVETASTPSSADITESWIKEVDLTTLGELELDQVDTLTIDYNGTTLSFDKLKKFMLVPQDHVAPVSSTFFRWKGKTVDNRQLNLRVKDGVVSGGISKGGDRIKLRATGNPNEVRLDVYGS